MASSPLSVNVNASPFQCPCPGPVPSVFMPPAAVLDPVSDPLFTQYVGALEYLRGLLSSSAHSSSSSSVSSCTPSAAPPARPLCYVDCDENVSFDPAKDTNLRSTREELHFNCLQLVPASARRAHVEGRARRPAHKSPNVSLTHPPAFGSVSVSVSGSASPEPAHSKRRRCTRYGIDDILSAEADSVEDAEAGSREQARVWAAEREARLARGLSCNEADRATAHPSQAQYTALIASAACRTIGEEQNHHHPASELSATLASASEQLDPFNPSIAQQHMLAALLRHQQQQEPMLPQHPLALISPSQPPLPPLINPLSRMYSYYSFEYTIYQIVFSFI